MDEVCVLRSAFIVVHHHHPTRGQNDEVKGERWWVLWCIAAPGIYEPWMTNGEER